MQRDRLVSDDAHRLFVDGYNTPDSTMCGVGSVVKYAGQGQSGQAIKLFQTRRNISFTFHF